MFPNSQHPYGLLASDPALDLLGKDLNMPEPNHVGSVRTWNFGGGFMQMEPDPFCARLIAFAKTSSHPLLEIGTAYGVATLPALQQSTCPIIANDICPENLLILRRHARREDLHRLYLNTMRFPSDLHFPSQTFAGILMCRVAHFLKGEEIAIGFKNIYDWLIPGGKCFFVIATPFRANLIDFIPIYEERYKSGDPWPGYIHDYRARADDFAYNLNDFFHVMDERPLKRLLEQTGFAIEELSYIDMVKNSKIYFDGREYIGAVAVKPS